MIIPRLVIEKGRSAARWRAFEILNWLRPMSGVISELGHRQYDYIVIGQPGKVGSKTMSALFRQRYDNVVHTHSVPQIQSLVKTNARKLVVTGVREPVGQALSAFNYNVCNKNHRIFYLGHKKTVSGLPLDVLLREFRLRLHPYLVQYVDNWYEQYATLLPCKFEGLAVRKDGFSHLATSRTDFFIYRLDSLEDATSYIHNALVSLEFDVGKTNAGIKKGVVDYSELLSQFTISRTEYEKLIDGLSYCKNFYDRETLMSLCKRWLIDAES